MKALVAVDAGICGFHTRIRADGVVPTTVRESLKGRCAGCAVLPKDVMLKISPE